MSLNYEFIKMLMVILSVSGACLFIQHFFRRDLERDQYYYLKDISLIAAWAICGIWTQSPMVKLTITAGVLAALVGFCQKVMKRWELRFAYLLIGLALSLSGPRIAFLGLPHGEFFYLSFFPSVVISTFWIGFFPILLQELDEIPGMGGVLLIVSWVLLVLVTVLSAKGQSDALLMAIAGLVLLLVFWSRHMNSYRRLGAPLAALWGTLLAGTSMLGVSKGIAFSTVMFLPLGFFALPILETSVSVLSAAFFPKPLGNMLLYRRLVNKGVDHPTAVYIVVATCGLIGGLIALLQLTNGGLTPLIALSFFLAVALFFICKSQQHPMDSSVRRPVLWGVPVDNVSLNYALSRVNGWIAHSNKAVFIVTPDALALLLSRKDEKYKKIINAAGLILPDGTGLIWALRFLGTPVQSRLPGVEFMEHLCKQAAGEGYPVYFLGGKPGIAEKAAVKLTKKYPGLKVVGFHDGYFGKDKENDIIAEIKNTQARLLFVGFGVPRQEYWLYDTLPKIGNVIGMGVGGSMDVLSGELRRAPSLWQRCGMEWFYRLIQEPWRWRRAAKLPVFVFLVLMTRLGIIKKRG